MNDRNKPVGAADRFRPVDYDKGHNLICNRAGCEQARG